VPVCSTSWFSVCIQLDGQPLTIKPWCGCYSACLQIQGQRVQVAKLEAERSALSRLDKIKADQGARATALEKEAAASELRANLIEYNLDAVDAALDAVNAGKLYDGCISQTTK
jgi:hypothetical protein